MIKIVQFDVKACFLKIKKENGFIINFSVFLSQELYRVSCWFSVILISIIYWVRNKKFNYQITTCFQNSTNLYVCCLGLRHTQICAFISRNSH